MSADNFEEWFLDIRVLDQNPLYLNEIYRLKFKFSASYPIGSSPSGSLLLPFHALALLQLTTLQSPPR